MADLTITAASVVWVSGTKARAVTAGASITAGQSLYQDASTGKYLLADANATAGDINYPTAIALTTGADTLPMLIAEADAVINIGATIAKATPYFQSATPGGIAPLADVATGWVVVEIGIGVTTANLLLVFKRAGFTF